MTVSGSLADTTSAASVSTGSVAEKLPPVKKRGVQKRAGSLRLLAVQQEGGCQGKNTYSSV